MNRYRKIFHHINIKDVKDRHLEEFLAIKLKQEKRIEEEKYITDEGEKLKVDWRKELEEEELKESDWTPISSGRPTMSTAQTFQHASGGTATFGGLGGSDVHPTQVTLTVSGETFSVDAPTFGELPLQGIPMPVSAAMPIHRRISEKKAEETNKRLDASEKVAAKAKADSLMKARVTESDTIDIEKRKKEKEKWQLEVQKYTEGEYANLQTEHYNKRDADAKERHAKVEKVVRDLGWKGSVTCWGTHEFQITGKYDPKKPSQKLIVIEKEKKLFGLDSPYSGGVVVHTITPYRNPDTGLYSKITKTTFKTPRKIPSLGTSKYSKPVNDGGKSEFGWSGIGNISTSSEFSLKDFPEPKYDPPKAPPWMQKNIDKGWKPLTEKFKGQTPGMAQNIDGDFIEMMSKHSLFNFKHVFKGSTFAGDLMIAFAKGDLSTVTKSPGSGFDNSVVNLVRRSLSMKDVPIGSVNSDVYNVNLLQKTLDLPVRASIGQFTYKITDKGIQVYDEFDFDKNTNLGAWLNDNPTLRKQTDQLVTLSIRRAAELGFDMKRSATNKETGVTSSWQLPPPPESTPEELLAYNTDLEMQGVKMPPKGRVGYLPGSEGEALTKISKETGWKPGVIRYPIPVSNDLSTPDGYVKIVDYNIPWSQLKPLEIQTIKELLNQRKSGAAEATPKSKGRLDAYGGVSKLHDKKKKKVSESKVFDKIKKDFSYKGKPSPDGFPDTPPPKLKNGWHPEYGKVDNRYNRLDPISAKSMPKTGEASIDKKVEKAKKKKK